MYPNLTCWLFVFLFSTKQITGKACFSSKPSKFYKEPYFQSILDCKTVVFGRFRKARSAVSVIHECEAREPHMPPFSLAVFTLAPDLSFEYGPSRAFAKNTTVLQSKSIHVLCC